jgi:hypothetical protein
MLLLLMLPIVIASWEMRRVWMTRTYEALM